MVVVLELVAHSENRHLALVLDLEQRDVARSPERNGVAMPDLSAAIA
jgi:hypothetical protein